MTKNKKILFSITTLGLIATLVSVPALAASCSNKDKDNNKDKPNILRANGYSDAMTKVDLGTATLSGGWGDTRTLIKNGGSLVVVGATEIIANDGVQARKDLKRTDVEAVQAILKEAIKDKKSEDLQIQDAKSNKKEFVFKVYNHNDYSTIDINAEISVDTQGNKKKAYQTALVEGGDYFEKTTDGKFKQKEGSSKLKIQFIPSNDPAKVRVASKALETYLTKKGYSVEITVANDYNAAATSLKNGSIDVAFLPAGSWAELADGTNFILAAGRGVQIVDPYKSINETTTPAITDEKVLVEAMNGYAIYNAKNVDKVLYVPTSKELAPQAVDNEHGYSETLKNVVDNLIETSQGSLPVVGFYRSYIVAKKDSPIAKKIQEALKQQGSNWTLPWSEVKDLVKYAYTSTTSSASYIFPEAWFKKHFTGFTTFQG